MQPVRSAVLGSEAINIDRDLRDHGFELFAAHRDATVALSERDDADRHGNPRANFRVRRTVPHGAAAVEPNQLRGATTDVEQDHAFGRRIDQWRAAGRGKPSLALAIDNFKLDADLVADALEKFEAVSGGAAGLGRNQPRTGDATVTHLGAADPQRIDRTQDRGLAQTAGAGDALGRAG